MVEAVIETFRSIFEENMAILECWLPLDNSTYQTCIELRVLKDDNGDIINTAYLSTWGDDVEGAYEEPMTDLRTKSEEELFQISTCYTEHQYHPKSVQYIQEILMQHYIQNKNNIPRMMDRKKTKVQLEIEE